MSEELTTDGCRCTLCRILLTEEERRAAGGACTFLILPGEGCRVCHVGVRVPGHYACPGCEKATSAFALDAALVAEKRRPCQYYRGRTSFCLRPRVAKGTSTREHVQPSDGYPFCPACEEELLCEKHARWAYGAAEGG